MEGIPMELKADNTSSGLLANVNMRNAVRVIRSLKAMMRLRDRDSTVNMSLPKMGSLQGEARRILDPTPDSREFTSNTKPSIGPVYFMNLSQDPAIPAAATSNKMNPDMMSRWGRSSTIKAEPTTIRVHKTLRMGVIPWNGPPSAVGWDAKGFSMGCTSYDGLHGSYIDRGSPLLPGAQG